MSDFSFENIKLDPDLIKGIHANNLFVMSQVQKKVIPKILERKTLLIQSNSGTGKTFTFLISAMSLIDKNLKKPQAIIIADTRELAIQIATDAHLLNEYLKLEIALCIGKTIPIYKNVEAIKNGAQLLVGTTGRIADLVRRYLIQPSYMKILILDEVDKLTSQQNIANDIELILDFFPKVQKAYFSATIPETLLKKIKYDEYINLCNDLACNNICQFYISCKNISLKIIKMEEFISNNVISQAIIFANTCDKVDFIYTFLKEKDYSVLKITGKMEQDERNKIMEQFRAEEAKFLIASNLIARGIDIPTVNLVINYDLPNDNNTYIHRIGRCGRFGSRGIAISLITKDEISKINELETYMNKKISKATPQLSILEYLND